MPPTYNNVMSWRPEALGEVATAVRALGTSLDTEAPKIGNPVLNLSDDQWSGYSREAADTRSGEETRWLLNVSDKFGDLATAMEDGMPNIRSAMDVLKGARGDAQGAGYVLDNGDTGYAVTFDAAAADRDDVEFDQGAQDYWHSHLKGLGTAADTAVSDASRAITAAMTGIGILTPSSIAQNSRTIDPDKAVADSQAILTGTATPEQRARFERAMQLTPEQLARLNRGEPIDISADQMRYIQLSMGAIDVGVPGLSGIPAFNQMRTRLGFNSSAGNSVANGLQILSNTNVRVEGTPDMCVANGMPTRGSFNALPQSIKDSLTRSDLVKIDGKSFKFNGALDNAMLGGLLAEGDDRYQAGTQIDRAMTEVIRQYADGQAKYEQESGGVRGGDSIFEINDRTMTVDGQNYNDYNAGDNTATISPFLQQMMAGPAGDKMAIEAAVTSETNGQDLIHDLMTLQWDNNEPVAQWFTFDSTDANVQGPVDANGVYQGIDGNDLKDAELQGNVMEQVGRYMASKEGYTQMMDMPYLGADGKSFGESNPQLAQALADSFSPYAENLGGWADPTTKSFDINYDPTDKQGGWANPLEGNPERDSANGGRWQGTERILAALTTDEAAGETIQGAMNREVLRHLGDYGEDPNAGDAGAHLELAGVLQGVMDDSIDSAMNELAVDEHQRELDEYELRGKAFDLGSSAVNLGLGKLPGSEFTGPLTDEVIGQLRNQLVGPEPEAEDAHVTEVNFEELHYTIAAAVPDIQSYLDEDFIAEHSKWFDDHGRLKTLDEIKTVEGNDESFRTNGLKRIVAQLDSTANGDIDDLRDAYEDTRGR